MRRRSNITTIALQKRVFWGLIISMCMLVGLYGYFVSKSITNVLLREEVEQEIVATNSKISELEFAYLNEKNKINLSFAYAHGFTDVKKKEFVARRSVFGERLTLNNEI